MAKAIVIYNSRGGNTKKVATKIAEGLGAEIVNQKKIPNLKDYNLVVVGTWVMAGSISPSGKKYLNKLDSEQLKGKKIAMFISAAGPEDPPLGQGPEAGIIKDLAFDQIQNILKVKELEVVNERIAIKGAFRIFRFGSGAANKGMPDENGLEEAKKFGETLKKYLK
ncbi:MAG: flavodoxin family protein [Candidatus Thorarchaeota archaeon]